MLEIYLRVPAFTYSVYAPFTKQKGKIQENKEAEGPKLFLKWIR